MGERSLAFVVKIWHVPAGAGSPTGWHGRIDDVEGQTGMSFDTLLALCAFLSEHSGMAGAKVSALRPDRLGHLAAASFLGEAGDAEAAGPGGAVGGAS